MGPEGLAVLEELRSDLGLLLWKQLRSVLLWADVSPSERVGLFPEELAPRRQAEVLAVLPEEDHDLRGPLEELLEVIVRPDRADPERMGLACSRVATWAESEGAQNTALEFLQAAAVACPANPRFALAVMKTSRDLAQYPRAEAWFHRVVGLSRQCRDWETYIRAYIAHGTMMLRKGALPAARRSFLKAYRRAARQGLKDVRAMALHDLFVVEYHLGNEEKGDEYAAEAVALYGPEHERFPRIAHDIAFVWLMKGAYENAMKVLESVLPRLPDSAQATVNGTLARAAAGAGTPEVFESARKRLRAFPEHAGLAEAWVEVARGALILGRHEEAREAAVKAESLARRRLEGQVRFMAESVLDAVNAEEKAAIHLRELPAAARSPSRDELEVQIVTGLRESMPTVSR
ncbi:MAG: hypothetical protein EA351_13910 [Gemmatimonadales bacterium]|nr:MAG: hypothetical protein EA351_13910 [Gemmatimonadales bacterium]